MVEKSKECDSSIKMPQGLTTVDLNKLVKVRFLDGYEVIIRIVEQKMLDKTKGSQELVIDARSPLAQAIVGHSLGEEVEYMVAENTQKVKILEIQ